MSYYRAALAAAHKGDKTLAARLVNCSIVFQEDAPNASRLRELLLRNADIAADTKEELRQLIGSRKFSQALKVRLPKTAKAYTIRGLLYAQIGRKRPARMEFAKALSLDAGNSIAIRALRSLQAHR